jgi:hypothetical protein
MGLWKRMKKAVNRFLEDLAKENKESFGEGKLDCCQLNRRDNTGNKVNKAGD